LKVQNVFKFDVFKFSHCVKLVFKKDELRTKQGRVEATINFVSFDLELRAESFQIDIESAFNEK
jgi:hypothetical protein